MWEVSVILDFGADADEEQTALGIVTGSYGVL